MSLIKCNECGQMFSDKATKCPKCGSPLDKPQNPVKANNKSVNKKTLIVAAVLVVAMGIVLWSSLGSGNDVKITSDFAKAVQKYESLGNFEDGMAYVCRNGQWGYIDTKGKEIIPCRYAAIYGFIEGMAIANYNGLCGFIDKTGKEIVPCKYMDVSAFNEGLAKVHSEDGKSGFIDQTGKEVIPCKYYDAYDFNNGIAAVANTNYEWGFIDKQGNEIVPFKYTYVNEFSDGMAAVANSNREWGYVDNNGKEVIRCQYAYAAEFSEGIALVSSEDLRDDMKTCFPVSFINKKGDTIIKGYYFPNELSSIDFREVKDGKCFVRDKDKNIIWYDTTGKLTDPPTENEEDQQQEQNKQPEWESFTENGKYGLKDSKGNIVIQAKYSSITGFSEGVAVATLSLNGEKKEGYVDKKGNDTFTDEDWKKFR